MRNVNLFNLTLSVDSVNSFILTMRNVNLIAKLGEIKHSIVLY